MLSSDGYAERVARFTRLFIYEFGTIIFFFRSAFSVKPQNLKNAFVRVEATVKL